MLPYGKDSGGLLGRIQYTPQGLSSPLTDKFGFDPATCLKSRSVRERHRPVACGKFWNLDEESVLIHKIP